MNKIDTNGKGAGAHNPPDTLPNLSPAPGHVLTYRYGGVWGEAPDPMNDKVEDFDDAMRAAGFLKLHRHGLEDAAFWLEVFENNQGGRYIVVVNTCSRCYPVLVRDVPSLMALLRELLPVIEASHRLEVIEDAEYERKRIQRKGPTVYNHRERRMEYERSKD